MRTGSRAPYLCEIRISALAPLTFELPAFRNGVRYRYSKANSASTMSSPSLMKFDPRTPESRLEKVPPPKKLDNENVLNRQ